MKRILIDGMCNKEGGVEHFIYQLYLILKKDWQVDFITIDDKIPFESEFLENGSTIYKITPRYVSVRKYIEDIECVFKKTKYDVLWFNKMSLSSIACIISAKHNKVGKIICHSHASNNMGGKFTYIMHKLNSFRINKYVDTKLACSSEAAHWFFGNNINDVDIFPNSIDIKKYVPSVEIRNEVRKELNICDKFVLCHIGRFSKEKNHTFLIDVFSELCKKIDAHLLLCGEGDLFPCIKEKVEKSGIESKVSFLGMRRDIPNILQSVDVLLLPSLHEGLPITLVEAQAAGVPCIVSDTVSREAALTELVQFVSLKAPEEVWINEILKYKEYTKVSHEKQLEEKGFGLKKMNEKVEKLLQIL